MAVLTLSPKEFLQKHIVEGIANQKFEEKLNFVNLFDIVPTDATAVSYSQDTTSTADDINSGVMGKPLDLSELSELPTIEVTAINQKHGMLNQFGMQIKVSERDIQRSDVIDDLNRAVNRGTYAMASKKNDDILATLKATANDITEVSGYKVWSDDEATPINDIITFKNKMKLPGYEYKLTDLFVHIDNFNELEQYMVGVDKTWNETPIGPDGEYMAPQVRGVNIHEANSTEIAEGSYLGIDGRAGYQPMTIYAYRNPKYANAATFPIINVNQYTEEKHPHNIVTEFIAETFDAVKAPNALTYKSSGI